ncbi:MAG: RpiB/LacA/LacB family sugar-phosphate isomerase, partial [Proteiniphilum sp.]|nr:RpiB/LacA/LacB family sugar-phosphate isomerase [Proteiniphilum sp.]
MPLLDKTEKPIGLASDHAGYKVKQFIIKTLEEQGIPYKDFGAYSEE